MTTHLCALRFVYIQTLADRRIVIRNKNSMSDGDFVGHYKDLLYHRDRNR